MSDTFRNARALVIGVGGDLPVTANDAKAVAKIFADPERCAVPQRNVKILADSGATHDGIVAALEELAQLAQVDDVVTVYFSGHGVMVPTAPGRAFLVPHDGKWLDGGRFTELLGAIQARRLLVLLDCCYAGGIHRERGIKSADFKAASVPFDPAELQLRTGSGTVVLSSCRPDEISLPGKPYSIFTQVLIEALCGAGASEQDGYVRVTDLAMYVAEWVPRLTGQRQHPTLGLEAADNYPVAYYAAGSKTARRPPRWFEDVAASLAQSRTIASPSAGQSPASPETAMTVDEAIRALHEILVEYIYEKDEATRIVRHSKTPVPWSGDQISFWDKVLNNAHRSSRMTKLFALCDEVFGENADWYAAKQDYLSACEAVRRARTRDADGSGVVKSALSKRYLRELGDALESITPECFRDPRIGHQRLRAASTSLLAVEQMAAMIHAKAEAETRQPKRHELQQAAHALVTHQNEVAEKISTLRKVGSERTAKPLCEGLSRQAAALITAYTQAIKHMT